MAGITNGPPLIHGLKSFRNNSAGRDNKARIRRSKNMDLRPKYLCLILLSVFSVATSFSFTSTRIEPLPTFQNHSTHQGMTCFFGVLHAHGVLSPDFLPRPQNMQQFIALVGSNSPNRFNILNGPIAAWREAALDAKLDFLALTEHAHGPEQGQPEFCDHEMPRGGHQLLLDAAAQINNNPQFRGKFLAIPGVEWSTIGSGNHINIFFARNPVPSNIPNGNFRSLVTDYVTHPNFERNNPLLLVQMNHPNNGGFQGSYGRRQFPAGQAGDREFARFFSPIYVGIEHINNHNNSNENDRERNDHRDGEGLAQFYLEFLNKGFNLAPVGDHDNHRANWGRHTAARTGVWARDISPAGFVEGYKARRVFATEDNEMSVLFMTTDQWMGSRVPVAAAGEIRTFTVRIEQMKDTEAGVVQNEGPYRIELIGDENGVGGAQAARVAVTFNGQQREVITVQQGETVQFTRRVRPSSYYFIHVRETQGKDASNTNADAWTAPIFFINQ